MKRTMALLLALLASPALAADAVADKLLDCMRSNIPQTLRIQDFVITTTDRGKGKRVLRGRLFAKNDKGLVRSTIKILEPADLANAAYLMREGVNKDDMYVYLPALNRTRRITGASADGPLFGTDLSYSDIKQVQNAFSGGPIKMEASETLDGRPVQVLSMVPNAAAESRYSLVKTWVDAQSCVALKAEFFEGGSVRKRLLANAKSLKQSAGHWYADEAVMSDLKQGTQTTLKITGVTSDAKLSDTLFGATTFYIGG